MSAYRRIQTTVEAVQIGQDATVEVKEGSKPKTITVKKGDWLVTEGNKQFFISKDEFDSQFEPVP